MNKSLTILILGVLVIIVAFFALNKNHTNEVAVTSFEECVAAGNPVEESFPEQCRHNGQLFVRILTDEERADLNAEALGDLIVVNTPSSNSTLTSGNEYTLSGQARGLWYFEATFPFDVVTEEGDVLVQSYAMAEGEWMTTEFVPFLASFTLDTAYAGPAYIVVKKSNASGLPEHDASLSIPVDIVGTTGEEEPGPLEVSTGSCFIGGCSSHVCSDNPDVVTTCEWKEAYACYSGATCERQESGQCGWTLTDSLAQCLFSAGVEVI